MGHVVEQLNDEKSKISGTVWATLAYLASDKPDVQLDAVAKASLELISCSRHLDGAEPSTLIIVRSLYSGSQVELGGFSQAQVGQETRKTDAAKASVKTAADEYPLFLPVLEARHDRFILRWMCTGERSILDHINSSDRRIRRVAIVHRFNSNTSSLQGHVSCCPRSLQPVNLKIISWFEKNSQRSHEVKTLILKGSMKARAMQCTNVRCEIPALSGSHLPLAHRKHCTSFAFLEHTELCTATRVGLQWIFRFLDAEVLYDDFIVFFLANWTSEETSGSMRPVRHGDKTCACDSLSRLRKDKPMTAEN